MLPRNVSTPRGELSDALITMQAVKLGDGYLSTWRIRAESPPPR